MIIAEEPAYYGVNYKPGYIGFTVSRNSLISQGIAWFEKWEQIRGLPIPTHTFIICGEDETIEAFAKGVARGSLAHYVNDPDCCILVRRPRDYTPELGQRIVAKAAMHIGEGYGYWLIAAMAVTNSLLGKGLSLVTGGWFGKRVERWADGKRSQICSELVARCLAWQPELVGLGILKDAPATVTPMELFRDDAVFESGATELT